jgi:hypothetical protein
MKFVAAGAFTDPDAAARKLVEMPQRRDRAFDSSVRRAAPGTNVVVLAQASQLGRFVVPLSHVLNYFREFELRR